MKTKRWTWEEIGSLSPQQIADRLNHKADVLRASAQEQATPREILIDKLADTMDRENAAAFVDEQLSAMRQQAEQARDLLQKKAHDWNAEADRYLAQRDELTIQVAALTQALKDYGQHREGCPAWAEAGPCTCGLDAALTEARS
jgi:hypothetical protein